MYDRNETSLSLKIWSNRMLNLEWMSCTFEQVGKPYSIGCWFGERNQPVEARQMLGIPMWLMGVTTNWSIAISGAYVPAQNPPLTQCSLRKTLFRGLSQSGKWVCFLPKQIDQHWKAKEKVSCWTSICSRNLGLFWLLSLWEESIWKRATKRLENREQI